MSRGRGWPVAGPTHVACGAAPPTCGTANVNAAITGLRAAGATEIVVVDGHGSGNAGEPDVHETQLVAPAKMMSRDSSFDIYMDSYDHSYDAIVAVAMHAGAGNGVGFLSHTYTFEDVAYRVNGVPFNKSMILAAGAARLKIPLIMVSGDAPLGKEVARNLPWGGTRRCHSLRALVLHPDPQRNPGGAGPVPDRTPVRIVVTCWAKLAVRIKGLVSAERRRERALSARPRLSR